MDRHTFKILDDMQKYKLFDSAALRAIQAVTEKINFSQMDALYAQQAEHWKRIEEMNRRFSSIDFERIQSQALEAMKRLESIDKKILADAHRSIALFESNRINFQSVFNSPAFTAITDTLARTVVFEKSFLSDIAEKLRGFSVEIENEAQKHTIIELKDSLIEKANQLPKGMISFEGMLQFVISLVALLFAILGYQGSNDAAKQAHHDVEILIQQIEKLPEEIIPKLAPLHQTQTDSTWYVVERQCSLYSRPSVKSSRIGAIYPNQRVQLIQRKQKWIYVQYFDFVDGLPRNGWVMKKYLKLMPH